MTVYKECPGCCFEHKIEVDEKRYKDYEARKGFIQDLFPELNAFEREFLKTGYCPKCQEKIYGSTYTGNLIKEVE